MNPIATGTLDPVLSIIIVSFKAAFPCSGAVLSRMDIDAGMDVDTDGIDVDAGTDGMDVDAGIDVNAEMDVDVLLEVFLV